MGLTLLASIILGMVVTPDDVQDDALFEEEDELEDELVVVLGADEEDGLGVGVDDGVGAGVEVHDGTVKVSVFVEIVPPNDKALPLHATVLPIVIPESSMAVPKNVELAPRVVAEVGVQNTSQAFAPPVTTPV